MRVLYVTKITGYYFISYFAVYFKMNKASLTAKIGKEYEDEMHKLNTELQIALLKWKISSMDKKPKILS
jgi:hypothetical protein